MSKSSSKIRLVYGFGINDADYVVGVRETVSYIDRKQKIKIVSDCPFYRRWTEMLRRCYSEKFLKSHPTYIGCVVCEEWRYFSNFKKWMETNGWEGKHLDKDILGDGKLYSPDTCCFISQEVNKFLTDRAFERGAWPIGVTQDKRDKKFQVKCGGIYLGRFSCPEDAHKAWLACKVEQATRLAATVGDERVSRALIEKYTNTETHQESSI